MAVKDTTNAVAKDASKAMVVVLVEALVKVVVDLVEVEQVEVRVVDLI